jgi:hypothetical protein
MPAFTLETLALPVPAMSCTATASTTSRRSVRQRPFIERTKRSRSARVPVGSKPGSASFSAGLVRP